MVVHGGTSGVIPNSVQSGDSYTKSYSYKVPSTFKNDRVSLIGLVQMYGATTDNRQILNAVEQGLLETKLPSLIVNGSISTPYIKATTGTKISKKVTFTNPNDKDVDVNIAINIDSSNYPDAWNVTVEPETATIPANGSVEATITMTPDDEMESAKVVVNATPIVTDAIGIPGSATAFALSDKVKYAVIYGFNPFVKVYSDALLNIMTDNIGSQAKIFTYPADKEFYEGFIDQFNAVVISISGGFLADAGNNTVSLTYEKGFGIGADPAVNPDYPNIAKYVKSVMDAGKRVLLSAPNSLWWNQQTGFAKNQDATDLFNILGVDLLAAKAKLIHQTAIRIQIGFTVNGISKELFEGSTGVGTSSKVSPNLGYTHWTNTMKIQAGSKSKAVSTLVQIPVIFSVYGMKLKTKHELFS
ncbi:MAG: hypothetical protein IPM69_06160 [Ignavibacteria bacterium]|nr:hypothetical protein [Ignavibacteria bacterium]